jgi:hypothetical protein
LSGERTGTAAIPPTPAARARCTKNTDSALAIRWFVEKRLSVCNGQVLLDGEVRPEQGLVAGAGKQAETSQ